MMRKNIRRINCHNFKKKVKKFVLDLLAIVNFFMIVNIVVKATVEIF